MQDEAELQQESAGRMRRASHDARGHEQYSTALQDRHESLNRAEFERLKRLVADTKAERDAALRAASELGMQRDCIRKEAENLKSSLAKATSRLDAIRDREIHSKENMVAVGHRRTGLWNPASAAAVSVLAVASFFATLVFDDAQSRVNESQQPEATAASALEAVQLANGEYQSASGNKPPPRSGKGKTRFARVQPATQRQWGPSLWMPNPDATKPYVVFDPLVKQQQQDLLALGFDVGEADGFLGIRTREAMDEFRVLYLPESTDPPEGAILAAIISNYATLARNDSERFGIDQGVVAAIRLSSVRTGVDFSYLMKLAATESNFQPASKSATSSATGMYQFTRDTWLNVLKIHGAKYGLADYVAAIEYRVTLSGYPRPIVRDVPLYEHLLALRKNPRISAMMAAESVRDNRHTLTHSLDREPTQADLYLTHFLGAEEAMTFLRSLKQDPGAFAVDIFPEAASSNRDIFHPKTCKPRTVDEVYELFGAKFSTRRYDELAVN